MLIYSPHLGSVLPAVLPYLHLLLLKLEPAHTCWLTLRSRSLPLVPTEKEGCVLSVEATPTPLQRFHFH